ncbi:hypothetical protein PENSOL_c006G09603 [Penicillium solitum]|uniref:Uncharacterized protein n=1 Tax=Penicillium solitum TaxID=60172 RepID=A0A1V6RD78_9EURO|nr:uncharacterized protein PENSOL_c006G09603 [Penicillium solitum]OQD99495.1 hypothetical protein PENSOL_c006G09603 [Penicillium solitum]
MFGKFRARPVSEQSRAGTNTLSSSVNTKMFDKFRASSVSGQSKKSSRVSRSSSQTGRSTSVSSALTEDRLRHRGVFLTYSQCSIESKDEFEKGFSYMLERRDLRTATYYGCRENHETEGIHYHVLVNLGKQPNWSPKHAQSVFLVEGNECRSLNISTPQLQPKQRLSQFIEKHVNYCEKEKGGDCFGERPEFSVKKKLERKRKWEEIGFQPTAPAKLAMLKEEFLGVFFQNSAKDEQR